MDTIAAIATGLTEAGISIIRLSGPDALQTADRVFRFRRHPERKLADQPGYTVHYGDVYEGEELLDEVLALVFRAPKSYTAEDVAEIHCHGGIYVTRRILRAVLDAGARPAEPGEFTRRAFLNGRIDLSRAESVSALIRSQTDLALRASAAGLRGRTAEVIGPYREVLLDETARIEAMLDDPEHFPDDPVHREEFPVKVLRPMEADLRRVIRRFDDGRALREGVRTALTGKPNAGKSSVLNLLCGSERAIVTALPGTTRDTIEETVRLGPVTLCLTDTAGIRQAADPVERIGVERARAAAENAELVLCVCDASRPADEDDEALVRMLDGKTVIWLLNKCDLPARLTREDLERLGAAGTFLPFSARTGEGMEELERVLRALYETGDLDTSAGAVLVSERQRNALSRAAASLDTAASTMEAGLPEDFWSIDLMAAYEALGEVTGESVDEDLIDRIFEKFCMGK